MSEYSLRADHLDRDDSNVNSNKRILARGCDPGASQWAKRTFPPMMGNPEYVPTTTDDEFFKQLESSKWSVIYFAPGACRFSAAKHQIPGSNVDTRTWTLDEYKEKVRQEQGDEIVIVESLVEKESFSRLKEAVYSAPDVG